MVKFFLKKSFFDGWDNFPTLFVRNAEYAALGILYFILTRISVFSNAFLFYSVTLLFLFFYSCLFLGNYGVVCSWVCATVSEHRSFFSIIKKYRAHLLFLFAVILVEILFFTTVIPFYFTMGSTIGYVFGVLIFWIGFLLLFPLQYFLPISFLKDETPINAFKSSIALSLSNKGFTFFLFLKTVLQLVLSIATIALMPGFTGVSISHFDAVYLLLLRNDYIIENKLSSKKKIDYEELFREEAEKLGKRNLSSIISPWKNK